MINLKRYRKTWRNARRQRDLIQLSTFVNDHSIYAKTASATNLFSILGNDDECLADDHKQWITDRVMNGTALFDRDVRHHAYLIKQRRVQIAGADWNLPRIRHLERHVRGSIQLYQGIETVLPFNVKALAKLNPALKRAEYRKSLRKLEAITLDWMEHTNETLHPRLLPKEEAFRALQQILAPAQPTKALGRDHRLDLQLSRMQVGWDHRREVLRIGRDQARVFTLKQEPTGTLPNLWGEVLGIQADMVIASSWQAIEKPTTLAHLGGQRQLAVALESFHGKASEARTAKLLEKDPGINQAVAINEAMDRHIAQPKHYTGWYTLTIVLHGSLDDDLDIPAAKLKSIFRDTGAELLEEMGSPFIGCVIPEYFGILPGAAPLQIRARRWENHNVADMQFHWAPAIGHPRSSELNTDYDNVYLTRRGTVFYKDTHYRKRAFELVTGESGGGKSVYQQDRIQSLLAKNPYLYIFDVGRSYEQLMRSCGAVITEFTLDDPPRVNPFVIDPTPDGREFVFNCVRSLAEASGEYHLTMDDELMLHRRIEGIFHLPQKLRRLSVLRDALTGDLRLALSRWCQGGQYGAIFDNVEDELTIGDLHLFEFVGVTKGARMPDYVEPLKAYIIYRINAQTLDPTQLERIKFLVLDEAQVHAETTSTAHLLELAIETWRKHNGMISVITPAIGLLGKLGDYVIQGTSSWVFFPNPEENPAVLRERFRFDDKKLEVFRNLPEHHFLLRADTQWIVLKLSLDEQRYEMFTTSPLERAARDRRLQKGA
jgi:type IV secretion system protein VirB4